MHLYAGVDGGGTKTLAVVVDAQGREVGRGQAAGSNCQTVGISEAARQVALALAAATAPAILPNLALAGLCIGLAGVDRPADRTAMFTALSGLNLAEPGKIWLGNDAELILGEVGLGLIAGTGSIALGRDHTGHLVRAGGWGHLIGDEGSGYDLGRRAVQAAVRASDGRGPPTALLAAILREWNLSEPTQLIGIVYSPTTKVADFARLTRLVSVAASADDLVAQKLLSHAAAELAKAVEAVAARLDFSPTPPNLALAGGLLLSEPRLRRPLLKRLRRTIGIGLVSKVREPALNAAYNALRLFGNASQIQAGKLADSPL